MKRQTSKVREKIDKYSNKVCCKCKKPVPHGADIIHASYVDDVYDEHYDEYYCPECCDDIIDEMVRENEWAMEVYCKKIIDENAKLKGMKKGIVYMI